MNFWGRVIGDRSACCRGRECEVGRTFLGGVVDSSQFKNNNVTQVCSGSEEGLCFEADRLLYHSTLGLHNKEEEAMVDATW